jgi:hypothetical protein
MGRGCRISTLRPGFSRGSRGALEGANSSGKTRRMKGTKALDKEGEFDVVWPCEGRKVRRDGVNWGSRG